MFVFSSFAIVLCMKKSRMKPCSPNSFSFFLFFIQQDPVYLLQGMLVHFLHQLTEREQRC